MSTQIPIFSPQLLSVSHFIQFIYLKDSGHIVLLYVSFKAFELIFYHDYKFISDFALYTV